MDRSSWIVKKTGLHDTGINPWKGMPPAACIEELDRLHDEYIRWRYPDAPPRLQELLRLFNERNVEYLVVGGYALAAHGFPRYTGDLDLWVDTKPGNIAGVLEALDAFGLSVLGLTAEDFQDTDGGRLNRLVGRGITWKYRTRLPGYRLNKE